MNNIANGGVPQEWRNIATSGCGVSRACMMVDHLTSTQNRDTPFYLFWCK